MQSIGQNIAGGGGAAGNPGYFVDLWGDEYALYNYNNATFDETTGHFTQLVWKETTSIGCAAYLCPDSGPKGQATGWSVYQPVLA